MPFTGNRVNKRRATNLMQRQRARRRGQEPDGSSEGGEVPERIENPFTEGVLKSDRDAEFPGSLSFLRRHCLGQMPELLREP